MKQLDRAYCESHREEIIEAIRSGKIFIYPTDTIYGIGADATQERVVEKLRDIKERPDKPFSIIAPSKQWITTHCRVPDERALDLLPGPYTLIVNVVDQKIIARGVNPEGDSLGVRIPDHWFTQFVEEAGVPFVTTSVNLSGQPHMEKLEDVPQAILDQVDYVIYEGEKKGKSSTKIVLTA